MTTRPCINDDRFIHDRLTIRAEVAPLCNACPLIEGCAQLGMGEDAGLWAGMQPTDPLRVAFRAAVRSMVAKRLSCPNGHPTETYGLNLSGVMPDDYHGPYACARCNTIRQWMDDVEKYGPRPIPETAPTGFDPIDHGTERGEQAHRRRGEEPCIACREGRTAARQGRGEMVSA